MRYLPPTGGNVLRVDDDTVLRVSTRESALVGELAHYILLPLRIAVARKAKKSGQLDGFNVASIVLRPQLVGLCFALRERESSLFARELSSWQQIASTLIGPDNQTSRKRWLRLWWISMAAYFNGEQLAPQTKPNSEGGISRSYPNAS